MSIAWATIALVTLLFPGVLFFVGQYLPERFTRDTTPRSALGQLAGVVLISLLVHGLYFTVQPILCALPAIPCVRFEYVLGVLNAGRPGEIELSHLAANLTRYRVEIFAYLVLTAALGFGIGVALGYSVARGYMRFLAQHRWVLDLPLPQANSHTYVHVLTRISHEGRQLVYKGRSEQFGLLANGQFSYIVLSGAHRACMRLLEASSVMDATPHAIGTKASVSPLGGARRLRGYFVIEGPDIANAIFDSYEVIIAPEDDALSELAQLEKASEREHGEVLEEYVKTGTVVTPPHVTCVRPFAMPSSLATEPGRALQLEANRPGFPFILDAYYAWRVGAESGPRAYMNNIVECNAEQVFPDVPYKIEPGNMTGPTRQGLQKLIARDPNARWDVTANTVTGSKHSVWKESPRVILVALFDSSQGNDLEAGATTITFNNFARVFVEGLWRGRPDRDIVLRHIETVELNPGTTVAETVPLDPHAGYRQGS